MHRSPDQRKHGRLVRRSMTIAAAVGMLPALLLGAGFPAPATAAAGHAAVADAGSTTHHLTATAAATGAAKAQAVPHVSGTGSITGKVTETGGNADTDSHLCVFVFDTTGATIEGSTCSFSSGNYTVTGLGTADYVVLASDLGGTFISEYYNGAPGGTTDFTAATTVHVTNGAASSGINVTLPAGGHITGTVTEPGGSPSTDIHLCVSAFDDAGDLGSDCALSGSGTTGTYDIAGLPSGNYVVTFDDSGGNYQKQFWQNTSDITSATPVAVTAGATTTGINATLLANGSTGNVPGAPAAPTATAGLGQATVSWSAPSDNGGSAITGYDVQYSSDGGTTWTSASDAFHTSTATTQTVTGLTGGTAYVFRVAAFNANGKG
ncbi:MAG TPA: fibronectin type III domain-containing protein, partial [Mycobacteriales bacterium]|nr:fibronectin type III domain-containing protein [Mycobacteriales bacterium]